MKTRDDQLIGQPILWHRLPGAIQYCHPPLIVEYATGSLQVPLRDRSQLPAIYRSLRVNNTPGSRVLRYCVASQPLLPFGHHTVEEVGLELVGVCAKVVLLLETTIGCSPRSRA